MNFDKPYWKNVFRDSDGTPSSSRLLTATIVFSALLWVSFLTLKNKHLPELIPVGEFMTTTTLSLYGVSKLSGASMAIFNKNSDKAPN